MCLERYVGLEDEELRMFWNRGIGKNICKMKEIGKSTGHLSPVDYHASSLAFLHLLIHTFLKMSFLKHIPSLPSESTSSWMMIRLQIQRFPASKSSCPHSQKDSFTVPQMSRAFSYLLHFTYVLSYTSIPEHS